jgi:hypothetical protein
LQKLAVFHHLRMTHTVLEGCALKLTIVHSYLEKVDHLVLISASNAGISLIEQLKRTRAKNKHLIHTM